MPQSVERWVERIRSGDPRAIARAITWVEDEAPEAAALLNALRPVAGGAYRIGLTGPPGVGKSSLTDRLIRVLRGSGHRVGVVAVDPTSPFTGGALLGDRVRMVDHALDPGVFIRSMGTRGRLGGLARSTKDVLDLLDAAGYDVVIAETVGVGQSELDVVHAVDTVILALSPAGGDQVQMLKAGIMEIADIFVVNKADLPGADRTVRLIRYMVDLAHRGGWRPPVLAASASEGRGLEDLWEQILRHRTYLEESGEGRKRRLRRLEDAVWDQVQARVQRAFLQWKAARPDWERVLEEVADGKRGLEGVVDEIVHSVDFSAGGPEGGVL
ncbi:MAG: methylmalonyl Co-A mutase-associated GTPase MeaB [Kyrpidia tusciae]|nr:methylmalonyl Co-A mutase-associated GTPase MeaB [Kyrpidia tusciae]MBE3552374.1 methylmalonyl Co-A mutase-associated GTPase MeaB [Kyrpidia tusciae]